MQKHKFYYNIIVSSEYNNIIVMIIFQKEGAVCDLSGCRCHLRAFNIIHIHMVQQHFDPLIDW